MSEQRSNYLSFTNATYLNQENLFLLSSSGIELTKATILLETLTLATKRFTCLQTILEIVLGLIFYGLLPNRPLLDFAILGWLGLLFLFLIFNDIEANSINQKHLTYILETQFNTIQTKFNFKANVWCYVHFTKNKIMDTLNSLSLVEEKEKKDFTTTLMIEIQEEIYTPNVSSTDNYHMPKGPIERILNCSLYNKYEIENIKDRNPESTANLIGDKEVEVIEKFIADRSMFLKENRVKIVLWVIGSFIIYLAGFSVISYLAVKNIEEDKVDLKSFVIITIYYVGFLLTCGFLAWLYGRLNDSFDQNLINFNMAIFMQNNMYITYKSKKSYLYTVNPKLITYNELVKKIEELQAEFV